jgi:DNA replication protein DnaC
MNTIQTIGQMQELRLNGMAESYQSQLELPINHQLEGHELIAHLTEAEKLSRSNIRFSTLLQAAKLRYHVIPESIECSAARNLTKSQWSLLLEGTYIQQGETVLITGSTGVGKSTLACSLGYQACLLGIKVRYFNLTRLIETILMAKTEGSYLKFLNQIEKIPLIIIDDFGLQALNKYVKLALLQIMEDRYEKKSIIITSQLPVSKWHSYLEEPSIADALLDRLTARSHRLDLKGDSRRKKK